LETFVETFDEFHGPKVFKVKKIYDKRGWFVEPYATLDFVKAGLSEQFTQESHSLSYNNVFRGLHYQTMNSPMGKLVRCTRGCIIDFIVDIRKGSPTYLETLDITLYSDGSYEKWVWVPPGFAHGFLCKSEVAEVQYKQTGIYNREEERSLYAFDFPKINERLAQLGTYRSYLLLSDKDESAKRLEEYNSNPDFYYLDTAPHVTKEIPPEYPQPRYGCGCGKFCR
jgi:dTDP-4-dehydrorhamnose 3,5-epimerase